MGGVEREPRVAGVVEAWLLEGHRVGVAARAVGLQRRAARELTLVDIGVAVGTARRGLAERSPVRIRRGAATVTIGARRAGVGAAQREARPPVVIERVAQPEEVVFAVAARATGAAVDFARHPGDVEPPGVRVGVTRGAGGRRAGEASRCFAIAPMAGSARDGAV